MSKLDVTRSVSLPAKPGWRIALLTGIESIPGPALHDEPITAVGKSMKDPFGAILPGKVKFGDHESPKHQP